jgi:muconolactone D-isomerase
VSGVGTFTIAIVNVPTPDTVDQILLDLPIIKKMGENV